MHSHGICQSLLPVAFGEAFKAPRMGRVLNKLFSPERSGHARRLRSSVTLAIEVALYQRSRSCKRQQVQTRVHKYFVVVEQYFEVGGWLEVQKECQGWASALARKPLLALCGLPLFLRSSTCRYATHPISTFVHTQSISTTQSWHFCTSPTEPRQRVLLHNVHSPLPGGLLLSLSR